MAVALPRGRPRFFGAGRAAGAGAAGAVLPSRHVLVGAPPPRAAVERPDLISPVRTRGVPGIPGENTPRGWGLRVHGRWGDRPEREASEQNLD